MSVDVKDGLIAGNVHPDKIQLGWQDCPHCGISLYEGSTWL